MTTYNEQYYRDAVTERTPEDDYARAVFWRFTIAVNSLTLILLLWLIIERMTR